MMEKVKIGIEGITEKQRIQIPFFKKVLGTVLVLYVILLVSLIARGEIIGVVALGCGIICFGFSFYFLGKGKITLVTWLGTIGLILGQTTHIFFMDAGSNPYALYRMSSCWVVIAIAKYILSTGNKEIFIFLMLSFLGLITKILQLNINATTEKSLYLVSSIVCFALCVVATILLRVFNGLLERLNMLAAKDRDNTKKMLDEVTEVIQESKTGLESGSILSENATVANDEAETMYHVFKSLREASEKVTKNANVMVNTSTTIGKNTEQMIKRSLNQSNSFSETSAAITEISATISNVNTIATQRSSEMNNLLQSLQDQKSSIQESLEAVKRVKESSIAIGNFVHTVEEIANQTGLLAMNASIEAAHAGSEGKGFAVIAQEIRKLSEETAKNSVLIADVLNSNEKNVVAASDSVTIFAQEIDQNVNRLKETVESLEGILMGISEMNSGTQQIMTSMQTIVEDSRDTHSKLEEVSSEITSQNTVITELKDVSLYFDEKLLETDEKVKLIQNYLEKIKTDAEQNVQLSHSINETLEKVLR